MSDTILGSTTGQNPVDNSEVTPQAGTAKDSPATSFDYSAMVGTDGALSDNWRDGLPEDIRGERCLDQIKTIGTLAKSYVYAQKNIGAAKIAIPNEHSSKEDWDAFYKAGGRPDNAESYTIDAIVKELPDNVQLDDAAVAHFRDFAFQHGLSQKAFDAAVRFDIERARQQAAAAEEASAREYDETIARLHADYGNQFNQVIGQCNKAMEVFGLKNVLESHGLLNNYDVVKALAGIGARISESRLVDNATPAPVTIADRIRDIRQNPDDPYFHKDHPAHKSRVEEMARLMAAMSKEQRQ